MSNASGWGMTARLISTHVGVLSERVSETSANFDAETASEDERDRLAATLRETAQVLASARAAFDKENADLTSLRTLIANDDKATEKLAERLAAGTISGATVTQFRAQLDANKARLPQELQHEADARATMDRLQKIVDALTRQLVQFDARANNTMPALAAAKAQRYVREMAIRQSVSQFQTAGETALERLQRLSPMAA